MGAFPFAEITDLLSRHDWRMIGRLATDTGSPLTFEEVQSNSNVRTALEDASADIQGEMIANGRYEIVDLEDLEDRARQHLLRVTCWIAMAYLFERRPDVNPDSTERYLERAEAYKKKLREGENMFNLPLKTQPTTPTIDGPTSVDVTINNLLPERMNRYFPVPVGSRLPLDRG